MLTDLPFYTKVIWPINMLVLGVASIGVFLKKGKWKNTARNLLFILVFALPLGLPFVANATLFMEIASIIYVVFFVFIFWEIIRFLIKPGYVNLDIISASACGYFLLIEMCAFLMQFLFYHNSTSFTNVSTASTASTYIDFVYYSTITFTTIGYGDITPSTHHTKLAASLFGVIGQFYSVVLIGILISKFAANQEKK
ncbi:potassium channel family protein [Parapedobacter tibetensis]|uniref:potassium channel family protein n=1 Tax=Parapedobacter tibetensis TaxID=2972951 RepID=UPI00214D9B3F|nr:potassium channel family protein [Parapedobacter tibetensis]